MLNTPIILREAIFQNKKKEQLYVGHQVMTLLNNKNDTNYLIIKENELFDTRCSEDTEYFYKNEQNLIRTSINKTLVKKYIAINN